MINSIPKFYPLIPGSKFPGDWFSGIVPTNIQVGENTMLDSSHCFKNYHSQLDIGLKIGSNVTLWRTSLAAEENGLIEIGDFCFLANASLVCSRRIKIGSRVFISGGVTIVDSDFHPLDPLERLLDIIALSPLGNRKERPEFKVEDVEIEDDVWIGLNATILKGVTIGKGAYIYPGSLVLENVLPGQKVSGNPAKPIV
ncbi:acyltransferase [Algoriphagus sp. D3-2-R+10]|uniref:acyltransferase n=1 Tax=Algoriphagus aurantiacus TaxID=3103948 RepID=UPI002B3AD890|nr:acyltransferase [Algoriphagus sp. D3-2-R+10]MEB2778194.1 acyltransferase [Algoriphagus sp. D3-2-R+10]